MYCVSACLYPADCKQRSQGTELHRNVEMPNVLWREPEAMYSTNQNTTHVWIGGRAFPTIPSPHPSPSSHSISHLPHLFSGCKCGCLSTRRPFAIVFGWGRSKQRNHVLSLQANGAGDTSKEHEVLTGEWGEWGADSNNSPRFFTFEFGNKKTTRRDSMKVVQICFEGAGVLRMKKPVYLRAYESVQSQEVWQSSWRYWPGKETTSRDQLCTATWYDVDWLVAFQRAIHTRYKKKEGSR